MVENHRLGRWLVFVNTNCVLCAAMLLGPQSWRVANGFFLHGFAGLIGIFPAESDCRSLSALDFRISEAQKPADYFSRKLFEQPIVFIRAVVINQASAGNRPRRLQAPELVSSVHCSLHSWRICDAIQQPFQRIKAGRHSQTSPPHGAADVSRAAASRCRTDRQPAANRTSTAPRISIPTTSSSFLRQKAPQTGIKHASAPALQKHMP